MFLKHLIIGVFQLVFECEPIKFRSSYIYIFTTPSVSKRGQNSKSCIVIDT